jgi:hypothetical protein
MFNRGLSKTIISGFPTNQSTPSTLFKELPEGKFKFNAMEVARETPRKHDKKHDRKWKYLQYNFFCQYNYKKVTDSFFTSGRKKQKFGTSV